MWEIPTNASDYHLMRKSNAETLLDRLIVGCSFGGEVSHYLADRASGGAWRIS